MDIQFSKYMNEFETKIVARGVHRGMLGNKELVTVKDGRLSRTAFGKKVGLTSKCGEVFVINYYGHMKKSVGFRELAMEKRSMLKGRQLKKMEATVVHFQALKVADLVRLAGDDGVELVMNFPDFKHDLLKIRNFRRK